MVIQRRLSFDNELFDLPKDNFIKKISVDSDEDTDASTEVKDESANRLTLDSNINTGKVLELKYNKENSFTSIYFSKSDSSDEKEYDESDYNINVSKNINIIQRYID